MLAVRPRHVLFLSAVSCSAVLSIGSLCPGSLSSLSVVALARDLLGRWFGRVDIVLHLVAYTVLSGVLVSLLWHCTSFPARTPRCLGSSLPSERHQSCFGWFRRLAARDYHGIETSGEELGTCSTVEWEKRAPSPDKPVNADGHECLYDGASFSWPLFWRAFVCANLLGLVLEVLQGSIPLVQRKFQWMDVIANALGAALGASGALVLLSRVNARRLLRAGTSLPFSDSDTMV
ncbi:hypothetical protein F1559_000348 [Cyanidiococcus yangmingshanensis]|uniref:Uncharacterized protein n=1 Tax=Cyanidiococcus yangmingshanensis TaxID=2690220 RepID=A0A7J7IHV2_9RHOD|nr:hypothetical protein F1559_000348 [Cyanidiococcus yangmingshanensis]